MVRAGKDLNKKEEQRLAQLVSSLMIIYSDKNVYTILLNTHPMLLWIKSSIKKIYIYQKK